MKTKIETGGPAFPTENAEISRFHYEGMTLRDWFAGQVLAGFAANQHNRGWIPSEVAADAYAWADEMIKRRRCA